MHPIFSHSRRLLFYVLIWIPIAGLVSYLLVVPGAISWRESLLLSGVLCILTADACLAVWYICRVMPLEKTEFGRLVLTHLAGAVVVSGIIVYVEILLARLMARTTRWFPGLATRLSPEVPLMVGVAIATYLLAAAFYYVIFALEASKQAEARVLQASVLARDAELKALKAQVNPHFLFNSLNSISALTSSDPLRAREMCILLGDFLRRTLGLGEKLVIPLEEELSLVRSFLAVEKVRFGARIQMQENIDKDTMGVFVPPLLLQPLVENAVVHGIANLVEGGSIRLDAKFQNGLLAIDVENSFDPEAPPRRRSGVGLANVRQRLLARYGNRATFDARTEGGRFCVAIRLPAETEVRAS